MTTSRIILALFTAGYLIAAAVYFTSLGNTEFLGYIGAVTVLLLIVACTLHYTCFPDWLLWLLSLLMLLHILGGGLMVGGDVLYNYVPLPIENPTGLTFIKVDQIVHTYGSAVAALFVYSFLRRRTDFSWLSMLLITVLAACGIGAINEIIEFTTTLTVEDVNVGGYYNTAVDLVVNLVGAIIGAALGLWFWKRTA
ncbi:MAG TPA: DUF2238 domain-containing protein [Candidatus Paceibacterota bacterium]|nr:DUF2238 domain-containing protein [Candidatus Paceibacterota bacterium]